MELEELLVQEGVAAASEQIREVLDVARRDGRQPAAALIEAGIVSEDLLADLLARASGTVVVDLDDVPLDAETAHLVPADVARELLILPLAVASGKLRVAFVNPLDSAATGAAEDATGMPIQPVVGTLTGLRAAIEKAYASRTTRVVRVPSGEMPHEITQKFEVSEGAPKDTSPLHRIEQEATIEQRHEALLLALIERGIVTRADYAEALKRLLSGRK